MYKFLTLLASLLTLLALQSCSPHGEDDLKGLNDWTFLPQECNYLQAYNFGLSTISPDGVISQEVKVFLEDAISETRKYCLALVLSSFDRPKYYVYDEYDPDSERNSNIENLLKTFLGGKWEQRTKASIDFVSYRKNYVKGITVVADKDLFGIVKGGSLNSLFEIYGAPDNHDYLIDSSIQLLGKLRWGWSIEEYLSYEPLAFPMIYLHLKEESPEPPGEVTFTVTVELTDRTLTSSTTVTLI